LKSKTHSAFLSKKSKKIRFNISLHKKEDLQMKIFLSASAIVILLTFARKITEANKNGKLLQPIQQELKKHKVSFDTFYAVQTIFQQNGKAMAKDTLVFIMHEFVHPKLKAGWKYTIESLPYNAFDTTNPVKAAADTAVWTYKPYKPK
jgi:hypothetical protein